MNKHTHEHFDSTSLESSHFWCNDMDDNVNTVLYKTIEVLKP